MSVEPIDDSNVVRYADLWPKTLISRILSYIQISVLFSHFSPCKSAIDVPVVLKMSLDGLLHTSEHFSSLKLKVDITFYIYFHYRCVFFVV